MKNKVLIFIIGVLIGAIIATGGFLIYSKVSNDNSNDDSNQSQNMQMNNNGGQDPSSNGDMQDPPEKPDGDNTTEPPEKPDGESNNESLEKPDDLNNNLNS